MSHKKLTGKMALMKQAKERAAAERRAAETRAAEEQKENNMKVVIIDAGCQTTRVGFAGQECPRQVSQIGVKLAS